MKFSSKEDTNPGGPEGVGGKLINSAGRKETFDSLIGGVGKGILGLTKKELRKLKRKEKENLWKRNRRNALPEPVVVHLPKEQTRSALQTVHKESGKARDNHFYQGGLNHDWVGYYDRNITSDQSCINEWNAMDSLESKRPPSPDSLNNKEETELLIRSKLKEIMMSVNIDEVTSKYIRQRLEEDIKMDLFKYKSFIDQEMLTILGQMDAATEIFPHVYLGSEWNASNLEELKNNGVGFILNVTKEIDNFFPGMFDYLNIRVYDDEKTELLRHWDDTYKYINQVKDKGSKVLVHCKMGISRSASVVIAYAMKAHNLSLEDAIKLVKNKRTCIKPNQAFTSQLKIYQGILDASRQRHNALFRSKSETNLKSSSGPSSHNSNMRLSYVPRGMQIFPIPDFRPRSCASVGGTVERGESEVTETCRTTTHQNNSENQPGSVTLRVPSPIQGRRPRSWSPDEDSTRNLSLHPYNDSEFGESLQKSRSLNDQAWHAHVTVVQRDLRDPGGGSVGLIEAVNPLYIPEKTSQSNQRIEDLQLSSSVKERINEFESAKNGVGGGTSSKCSGGKGPLTITLDQVTTTSSSTDDVEECVADTLVIFPPQITHSSTLGEAREDVDLLTSSISVNEEDVHNIRETPEDPPLVTWPTSGIVRKQKEDFEEKVKLQKDAKPRDQETILKQDCSHTENILRRQNSSQSLSAVENVKVIISPDGAMETIKKDDLFSSKVDKVFDREEKKRNRCSSSCYTGDRESPSRNNSWGSFDSAVVLPDRDAPSRQSSWGSCDTRLSGGSMLSRNSSFGAFDTKSSYGVSPFSADNSYQTSYVAFCIDKENLSSGRRIKPLTAKIVNIGNVGEEPKNEEYVTVSRSVSNSKVYMPLPFKTQTESDDNKVDLINSVIGSSNFSSTNNTRELNITSPGTAISPVHPTHEFDTTDPLICSLKSPDNHELNASESCYRSGVKRGFKSSPQTPEHEIPLPGTVKQQMQKLECKTKQILRNDPNSVSCVKNNRTMEGSAQGIGRSLSSGCVCAANQPIPIPISRSSSEKRAKTDIEGSKGNVKKITKALENQYSERTFPSFEMSRSFKRKGKRERPEVMPRSHSLERLGGAGTTSATSSPPTPNKRLSAYFVRSDMTSSQNFLDQLVVEAQAQVQQLEREQEEISVKNLVGLFEDVKAIENKFKSISTRQEFSGQGNGGNTQSVEPPLEGGSSFRHNIRPRSESMSERELIHLPPVPQRKSSLDHTFVKQPFKSVSSGGTTTTSALDHTTPGIITIGVTVATNTIPHNPKGTIVNPPKPPPLPATQNNRACGTEVRRRKQQGKTHPLSKLTPREKTL